MSGMSHHLDRNKFRAIAKRNPNNNEYYESVFEHASILPSAHEKAVIKPAIRIGGTSLATPMRAALIATSAIGKRTACAAT